MTVAKSEAAAKTAKNIGKSDLVQIIREEAGCTAVDAKNALEAVLGSVVSTVKKGGKVSLVGFGTFRLSKRAARTGRNPKTGEPLKVKASKSLAFKAGKTVKDSL